MFARNWQCDLADGNVRIACIRIITDSRLDIMVLLNVDYDIKSARNCGHLYHSRSVLLS